MLETGRPAESAAPGERPHAPAGAPAAQASTGDVDLCCWEFDSFWLGEREHLSWVHPQTCP